MYEENRWAEETDIKQIFSEIKMGEISHDVCGITVYYDEESYFVDSSDRNTILYGAFRADTENYFTLPLLDSLIQAGESFVLVDKDARIFQELNRMEQMETYQIHILRISDGVNACLDMIYKWNDDENKAFAYFLVLDDELESDCSMLMKLYNKLQQTKRINFVLNNFSSIPKILHIKEMLSEIRVMNSRFFLLGVEENQFQSLYNKEFIAIKNRCENIIFQNSKDVEFVENFSKLCGYSYETGICEQLIYMPELCRLEEDEAIMLCGSVAPIRGHLLGWKEKRRKQEEYVQREESLKRMEEQFAKIYEEMRSF